MRTDHTIILPNAEKAPTHTGNIFSWIWYFLSPYKKTVIGFAIWRLVRGTILGSLPIAVGLIVDHLENGQAFDNPSLYLTMLMGFLVFYTLSMSTNFVFQSEAAACERASRALTLFSIRHLNSLSLNWHEAQGSGKKLQRVMTGRKGFQEFMRHVRWDFFHFFGQVVAVTISFIVLDIPWHFLLLFAGLTISYCGLSWYLALPFIKLYDRFHEKFEKLLSGVYEFVSAIRTVKSFHLNRHIHDKAVVLEEEGQRAIMRTFWKNFIRWSTINTVAGLWLMAFAWFGFKGVIDGTLTIGAFSAIFFLAYKLWVTLEVISEIQEKLYEYGNGIYRLVETLRIQPKKLDIEPVQGLPRNWANISMAGMHFTYGDDELQGVHGINLHVKRGEKIAFIGESGAGKSTLVKLLMKQMLATKGKITVDDINLNHIKSEQWLGDIGFVPQDVELFNLSIRDNILIDRTEIDDTLYQQAIEQAALKDFIESLPDKDETIIGERGIKLSGGQRQRLGIARALVRQAEIIIFDEATSSLDSLSEQKIQTAMENSFSGHTVFLVAHRLSTVQHVDKIIVLEKGRIVEEGSFEELIAAKGTFAHLWHIQSKAAPEKIAI